ncbi:STAS domain-containing protein [Actinoplanes sp. NPDC089786]|uniref:STAS domain-containing protein n=1 Tax=Actinoplanes sp. NPDC089786 TaxID=3155185 RepID=UPI0034279CAE
MTSAPYADPAAAFSIISRPTTAGIRLAVNGEIDMYTAGHLGRAMAGALRTGAAELLIDLALTTFCDCGGITTLLSARHDAAGRTTFQVTNPTGLPLRVLQTLGVYALLTTRSR